MIAFIDALRSRSSQALLRVVLSRTPLEIKPKNDDRENISSLGLDDAAVITNLRKLRAQGLDVRVLVGGRDILN